MDPTTWLRLPDYPSWTWQTWTLYILAGTVGYVIRLSVTNKPLRLPRRGETGLFLNSLGEWATSVAVATLADHNLLFATCAGAGAPDLARLMLSWMRAAFQKFLVGDDSLAAKFLGPDDRRGRK
jgi:hypothetical protein